MKRESLHFGLWTHSFLVFPKKKLRRKRKKKEMDNKHYLNKHAASNNIIVLVKTVKSKHKKVSE